jgi:transcription elongation factor Elf1
MAPPRKKNSRFLLTSGAGCGRMVGMNQVRCPECHALNVTIVGSDEARGLITVQCFECGQETEIDAEAFRVDTGDLPQE